MDFIGILGQSKYLKLWTNALSMLLIGVVSYALFSKKISPIIEGKSIQFVRIDEIITPPKIDEKIIQQVKINQENQAQISKSQTDNIAKPPVKNHSNSIIPNLNIQTNPINAHSVHILPTPSALINNKPAGDKGNSNNLPQLTTNSQNTIYNIDCEKIDIKDRPKDCPKSDLAKRLVKMEQSKVKLDKVTGFTAAEMNSKKYAGWREPCENENGGKSQVCIQFGKKPTRVKNPYELCMEKGLGGCTRPKRPDGSDDEALNYGN